MNEFYPLLIDIDETEQVSPEISEEKKQELMQIAMARASIIKNNS